MNTNIIKLKLYEDSVITFEKIYVASCNSLLFCIYKGNRYINDMLLNSSY